MITTKTCGFERAYNQICHGETKRIWMKAEGGERKKERRKRRGAQQRKVQIGQWWGTCTAKRTVKRHPGVAADAFRSPG